MEAFLPFSLMMLVWMSLSTTSSSSLSRAKPSHRSPCTSIVNCCVHVIAHSCFSLYFLIPLFSPPHPTTLLLSLPVFALYSLSSLLLSEKHNSVPLFPIPVIFLSFSPTDFFFSWFILNHLFSLSFPRKSPQIFTKWLAVSSNQPINRRNTDCPSFFHSFGCSHSLNFSSSSTPTSQAWTLNKRYAAPPGPIPSTSTWSEFLSLNSFRKPSLVTPVCPQPPIHP